RVAHTVEGLNELKAFLTTITGEAHKAEMACIIEINHGLLIAALLEAGFSVYPVNPKTVDRKRNAAGAKTDQIDAYLQFMIERFGQTHHRVFARHVDAQARARSQAHHRGGIDNVAFGRFFGGEQAIRFDYRPLAVNLDYQSVLKNFCTSPTKSSGTSIAG